MRGFTLIELLVAISIMAVVAVLSWRGLDGMARAQAQTAERADSVLTLQAAMGQWVADLDAMATLPAAAQTQAVDWDGRVFRITRRVAAGAGDGVVVAAWARQASGPGSESGSQWTRWQSAPVTTRASWRDAWQDAAQWAQTPGDALRAREIAVAPLADWQVFYFRGNAWTNAQSSADRAPGAAGTAPPPPDGVRLVLDLPPSPALAGRITRDWVRPTIGGSQ